MENIKERLAAGERVEDLMKEMQDQIVAAAREIESEKNEKQKKKKQKIEQTRTLLIQATLNYLDAVGVVPMDTVTKEDVDTLKDIFKEMEAEMAAAAPIFDIIKKKEIGKEKTPGFSKAAEDIILRDFLKSL